MEGKPQASKQPEAAEAAPVEKATPKASPRKPATPEGMKNVTASDDLRVVTKDLVVVRLQAGKPRELPNHLVHAAQSAAGDKGVELTIE